jgi:hypothetical protein
MELDNIHIDLSTIDGYQKPFNFVVSPREDGKSTMFIMKKSWKKFLDGFWSTIIYVRDVNELNDALVYTNTDIINKWRVLKNTKEVIPLFNKTDGKNGFMPVIDKESGEVLFTFIALGAKVDKLKKLKVRKPAFTMMDEFIINPEFGGAYLKGEPGRFKELYNTYRRENPAMRCYFFGNPYTLYNPYFVDLGLNPLKLEKWKVWSNSTTAVWRKGLHPELYEKMLRENPLYNEDGAYKRYALMGDNIQDERLRITETLPSGYYLDMLIYIEGKTYGIYQNGDYLDFDNRFWVGVMDESRISKRRAVYAFDFKDMAEKTILYSREEKNKFSRLRMAMRNNAVEYQTIEAAYTLEEIYAVL